MRPPRFAQGPPGAILSGSTGRKPSGILSATVRGPWCLGRFSFPSRRSLEGFLAPPDSEQPRRPPCLS